MKRFIWFILTMALLPVSAFASRDSTSTDTTVVAPFSQGSKTRKVLFVRAGGWISAIGRIETDTLKARSGASIVLQGNFTDAAGNQQNFSHVQSDTASTDSLTSTSKNTLLGVVNITPTSGTWNLAGVTTTVDKDSSTAAITSGSITGVTLNNSVIGGSSAAAGTFTTLKADSAWFGAGDLILAPTQNLLTYTGALNLASVGSMTAPTLRTNDTNTGFYSGGTDIIGMSFGGNGYLMGERAGGATYIKNTTSTERMNLELFTADGDGTDFLGYFVYGKGSPASVADSEYGLLGWHTSNYVYIVSSASGTGTVRPLVLYTGTNTNQLQLRTSGAVSIEDDSLLVGATAASTNDIYIADRLADWDDSNYFLDPNSSSVLATVKPDSLWAGSGDLILAPTQNEFRLGTGFKFSIGDATPNGTVHIVGAGGAAASAAYATNPVLILENADKQVLQFASDGNDSSEVNFGDSDSDVGQWGYSHVSNAFYQKANAAESYVNKQMGTASFADDATLTIYSVGTNGRVKLDFYGHSANSEFASIIICAPSASPQATILTQGGDLTVAVTTSDVTGTTGVDGQLTVSVRDGIIELENRSGAVLNAAWETAW